MEINYLEWLGYLASVLVLISLLMSSIIKLRWINLIGSLTFSIYGFMIGALPVGVMNAGIVVINMYYLYKIYSTKDYFTMIPMETESEYFKHFLKFHKDGIKQYIGDTQLNLEETQVKFYVLRNMVPAGVFIASAQQENTLLVELDYVIPEYRDFKVGKFIFEDHKDYFKNLGFTKIINYTTNKEHMLYLEKMGFTKEVENGQVVFVKTIV